MLSIQGKNIYIEHPDKVKNILENISFNISQNSKIGLIGENGSGKTTFIKFLQGTYQNFKGNLSQKFSSNKKISIVVQEIEFNNITLNQYLWLDHPLNQIKKEIEFEKNLLENLDKYEKLGGYDYEIKIDSILNKFDFNQNVLSRNINEFSGGEKTKISIMKVILEDPELILFDEPTNNLDNHYIDWFKKYVKTLNKPFILISHDRNVLDECIESIWEIEDKNLKIYSGNYSFYKKQKEDYIENIRLKNDNIDKKLDKLKDSIIQKREKANSFENFKQSRSIKKNGGFCKRDEGSGSATLSPKKMMKSAISLENRYKKVLSEKITLKKSVNIKVLLEENKMKVQNILSVKDLSLFFKDHSLKNINFDIKPNDKVCILGKNGLGKSSLLKAILNINKNYSGDIFWSPQCKISYFSQNHENLDFEKTPIEEIRNNSQKNESEIRNVLAYLNLKEDKIFNKIKNLSLGERAKVIIAKIITSETNVLILDEPTNNLDIRSIEALEESLIKFSGSIIMVCHDSYFASKICNKFIDLMTLEVNSER